MNPGDQLPTSVETAASSLVQEVVGRPSNDVRELLGEQVHAWRLKNLADLYTEVQAILHDRSLDASVKALPTAFGFALIEAVSREDDRELRSLWANLLANNSDPARTIDLNKTVIDIVRQLSPDDARVLAFLARQG